MSPIEKLKLCHELWLADLDIRVSYLPESAREYILEYCKLNYIKILLAIKKNKVLLFEISILKIKYIDKNKRYREIK